MKTKKTGRLTPFGKAVKKKLIDKGLTMSSFAEHIGIDKRYLSDILYGRRSGAKYVATIAAKLEIDLKKYIA